MMENLENEFKRRFQNQEITDSSDQSDDLWDAISEEVDKAKNKPKTRLLYLWFLLFVMVAFSGGFYYMTIDQNSLMTSQDDSSNFEMENHSEKKLETKRSDQLTPPNIFNSKKHSKVKEKPDNLILLNRSENDKLTPPTKQKERNEKVNKLESIITDTFNSENHLAYSNGKNYELKNKKIGERGISYLQAENNSQRSIQSDEIKNDISLATNKFKFLNSNFHVVDALDELPSIPIKLTGINEDLVKLSSLDINDSTNLLKKSAKKLQWEIGLSGGINQLAFKYNSTAFSDIVSLKENSESTLIGTSFSVNTKALFDEKWVVSTGLEYHKFSQKFEFEQQTLGQVLKENQLLTIWVDASTSDTLGQRFDDTLVNSRTIRNVLNYNDFRQISIPIEFGWQHSSQKWIYGIMVGGVLNFTTRQEGKSLNLNGEIAEINQGIDSAPFKKIAIGLRISPFIGYQINEKWSLSLRPQAAIQSSGYSVDQLELRSRLRMFNLSFGVNHTIE